MLAILTTHPIQYQIPLWQALAKDGRVPFEVWYLTDHGINITPDREFGKAFAWDFNTLDGYTYRFLKTADKATPGSFWQCRLVEPLTALLHSMRVRALWVQGWQVAAYWQAVWAAKAAGVEVWLRGESNDLAPTLYWKEPFKKFLLGQLFKRVDHFFFIGAANRRFYDKFSVPASRLHPAPYAVDNKRFQRQAEALRLSRGELRKQWGIDEDAFCILFCGKFIQKKRPLDLVAAVKHWNKIESVVKPHLLFVGSGKLGETLRHKCQVVFDAERESFQESALTNESQRPIASFAGFLNQTEISQAYVAADCLVLPSDYGETWGLVVNEAMASGLPCIVSDTCGCAEDLVKTIKPQLCFKLGEYTQLAELLKLVASFQSRLSGLSDKIQEYDFSISVNSVVKIYRETVTAPISNLPNEKEN